MAQITQTSQRLANCNDSILVCALQFDGRGDIYGGHEVALRIQKLMPHAKVVFSILKPRFSEYESSMFSDKEFVDISQIQKQEQWEIEEESAVLESIKTFKKIIVFPTYHDSLLPPEILQRNQDVIKLREYSVGEPTPGAVSGPTYTLGLNLAQGEKGVLLPEKWSRTLPPHNQESSKQRLLHLKNVDPALSKAVLGNDFSQEAIDAFSKSTKLYMGYYSQPDVFFCFINALLTAKKQDMVILSTQGKPSELMNNIQEALWNNGFDTLKIIEFRDATSSKTQIFNFGNRKKTCMLIFRPLSKTEMDAMLRSTEDEALTTGDLSPFQFMGYRKTIVYDTRAQKHESAEAMIQLASQFDPRFKQLLPLAFFGAEHPGNQINVLDLENGMTNWIKALDQDPSLKENWNKFIDEIFSKRDFTPQLAQIVDARMLENAN